MRSGGWCNDGSGMSRKVCGKYAWNDSGQHVAAWDKRLAIKGATHKYFCICKCGDKVTLRQGDKNHAHFAYKADRRSGCKGPLGCKETEVHYNAKWLICDIFSQINFWTVCGWGHRITKNRYTTPEWTATVEKEIPGTKRIADVLLENSSTKQAVALEIYHTSGVGEAKKRECELAGVTIIEVKARDCLLAITPGCRDLNNWLNKVRYGDCAVCKHKEKIQEARDKAYHAQLERDERDRNELEELEREHRRVQNIAMELQNAARNAERIEQKRAREEERIEQERAREEERIEQERLRQETRARERERRERQDARSRMPQPRSVEQQRVHRMRLAYKRIGIPVDF
jgi:hypothetical protein